MLINVCAESSFKSKQQRMNWLSWPLLPVVCCSGSPITVLTLLTWLPEGCHLTTENWFIDGFCLTDSSRYLLLWLFFLGLRFHQVQVSWLILSKPESCQEGLTLASIFSQWKFPSYGLLACVDCIFCWWLAANISVRCWEWDLEFTFISKIICGLWMKLWTRADRQTDRQRRGQGRGKENGGCREGDTQRDDETERLVARSRFSAFNFSSSSKCFEVCLTC